MIDATHKLEDSSMGTANQIDDAELERLGIKRVQTESFIWGAFRYSNVQDAIAAARRAQAR